MIKQWLGKDAPAKLLVLLAALLALLVHHFYFHYGHFGYDDLFYSELAQEWLHGHFRANDHYSYRLTHIAALAFWYGLFGVNDFTSSLPALLSTLLIFGLAAHLLRRLGWVALLGFVCLYFSTAWNFFYANKLMPDLTLSACGFAAWYTYQRGRSWWWGILGGLCLFLAFNSKGTVILLLPLFAGFALYDLSGGRWRYWLGVSMSAGGLLLAYGIFCYVVFGSATHRLDLIAAAEYVNPCSYGLLPLEHLVERLTTGFWDLITSHWLVVHFLLLLVLSLIVALRSAVNRRLFWLSAAASAICLASMNFMTISLSSYNPVCLDIRHVLLFTPILSLASIRMVYAGLGDVPGLNVAVASCSLLLLYPTVELTRYERTLEYPAVREALAAMLVASPSNAIFYGSSVFERYAKYLHADGSAPLRVARLITHLPACKDMASDSSYFIVDNWYMNWHDRINAPSLAADSIERKLVQLQLRAEPTDYSTERVVVKQLHCTSAAASVSTTLSR